jgi:hypothetical protein
MSVQRCRIPRTVPCPVSVRYRSMPTGAAGYSA